jgi:hypothetical protein
MANDSATRLIHILLICPLFWNTLHLPAADRDANRLGVEVSYALRPFDFDDPYSGSLGGGIFYERHRLVKVLPIFLGGQVGGYGFYPLRRPVEDSAMLQAGLYLGVDCPIPVERRVSLSLAPYLGWRQYWRWMLIDGWTAFATRPVLNGGVALYLHAGRRALFGVILEAGLILDREPLGTLLQGERLGMRF